MSNKTKAGGAAWDPAKVGTVRGYPKSEKTWLARQATGRRVSAALHERGVFHRKGVPNGWAGRRAEVTALQAGAEQLAKAVVARMPVAEGEDPRETIALEAVVAILLDPTQKTRAKTMAGRIILDFCRPKPRSLGEDVMTSAEAFLAALARGEDPE